MSTLVLPKNKFEHKSVLHGAIEFDPFFQIKAVDDAKGIIQAYASKFGNEDSYGDIVVAGAYKRTLGNQRKANRPYLYTYLLQHDPNMIIGGIKEADEDSKGLLYQAQCNLDVQLGREAYSNAKMGVLYQSSIGYDVPDKGCEYKDGIRYLKEIRLWEISLVTFAANPEATVVDVKSAPYEIRSKSESATEKKTFADHFAQGMCEDLLEDWPEVYLCNLTCSVLDALKSGDAVADDISTALDAFKEQVMAVFVSQAMQYGLPQYVIDNSYSYSSADYTMQNGSQDSYGGFMSRPNPNRKAGRAISATNQSHIDKHVANLHEMADKSTKSMQDAMEHMKALHASADDLATNMQGSEQKPDTSTSDEETDESKTIKSPDTSYQHTRVTQQRPPVSTAPDTKDIDVPASLLEEIQLLRPVKSLK